MSDGPIRKRTSKPDEHDILIALLREYTEKLKALGGLSRKGEGFPLKTREAAETIDRLWPVAVELASYTSQQIEFRGHNMLVRLELQLRLAEFEAALKIVTESLS